MDENASVSAHRAASPHRSAKMFPPSISVYLTPGADIGSSWRSEYESNGWIDVCF